METVRGGGSGLKWRHLEVEVSSGCENTPKEE